jgi:glycerol-3-phosphate dehydrogenase (NAD(P)+)
MKCVVLGAGSWGTAVANVLADNGHDVTLWTRESSVLFEVRESYRNSRYLPGIELNHNLKITDDLKVCKETDLRTIVFGIPSHAIREICRNLRPLIANNKNQLSFISLTKGIENDTLLTVDQILEGELGIERQQFAVLSGPSHAEEVARRLPTVVTVASENAELAKSVQSWVSNVYFRAYSSIDVKGVEMGGSVKNVFAIAAGILDGLGYGDNTKAALMTRATVEMRRIGQSIGANPETFFGLSGIGDLIVTCTSKHSRNRHVGEELGKGKTLKQILAEMIQVAEGVKTTKSVWQVAQKYALEMPITEQVYLTLYEDKKAELAIRNLMLRDLKPETSH